jgi:hypothetical protein
MVLFSSSNNHEIYRRGGCGILQEGDGANLQSDTPRRVPREDGTPRAGPGADENSRDIYTRLTHYRKDDHPSVHRIRYDTEEEDIAALTKQDCHIILANPAFVVHTLLEDNNHHNKNIFSFKTEKEIFLVFFLLALITCQTVTGNWEFLVLDNLHMNLTSS